MTRAERERGLSKAEARPKQLEGVYKFAQNNYIMQAKLIFFVQNLHISKKSSTFAP